VIRFPRGGSVRGRSMASLRRDADASSSCCSGRMADSSRSTVAMSRHSPYLSDERTRLCLPRDGKNPHASRRRGQARGSAFPAAAEGRACPRKAGQPGRRACMTGATPFVKRGRQASLGRVSVFFTQEFAVNVRRKNAPVSAAGPRISWNQPARAAQRLESARVQAAAGLSGSRARQGMP
jgi:hypothetical protein